MSLKRMPFKARKSVFEKLEKIVDIASLSKEEREKYDESIKVYRDNLAVMAYAKEKNVKRQREVVPKGLKKVLLKDALKVVLKGLREVVPKVRNKHRLILLEN